MSRRLHLATYLMLMVAFLIYSTSGVFLKLAAYEDFLSWKYLALFALVIVVLGVYAVLWQMILKKIPLSQAFLFKSTTVVFSLVYACLIFSETLRWQNVLGAALIMAGIIVNSKSREIS